MKKILSITLSLAILASCIFVGGITAVAQAPTLYTTVNTYDDESTYQLTNVESDSRPAITAEGDYYYFGSYGTQIATDPINKDDNVVLFDRAVGDRWPTALRIYEQGTGASKTTFKHFKPKANTTYEISLE